MTITQTTDCIRSESTRNGLSAQLADDIRTLLIGPKNEYTRGQFAALSWTIAELDGGRSIEDQYRYMIERIAALLVGQITTLHDQGVCDMYSRLAEVRFCN